MEGKFFSVRKIRQNPEEKKSSDSFDAGEFSGETESENYAGKKSEPGWVIVLFLAGESKDQYEGKCANRVDREHSGLRGNGPGNDSRSHFRRGV
jgi:hypothetical protein